MNYGKLLVAGAIITLGTGASAQVVTELTDLGLQNVGGVFISTSENYSDIQGDVDISVGGSNGFVGRFENSATGPGGASTGSVNAVEVGATTAKFGDIATTAAGAVNETTTNIIETAADALSSAGASTSNTNTNASDELSAGSGILVVGASGNDADIFGNINVDVAAGSTNFGGMTTTAAGSINSSDFTASFVGTSDTGATP